MIEHWKKVGSKPLGDYRIFTVRSDIKVSPRNGKEHDFFVIDCVNWVNVIATTPDDQIVLVEQYRHGSDTVELEIPGGMMDPEDQSPILTGLRELREETGFEGKSDTAEIIGKILPNPAIMSNICYTVLVENCVCKHPVAFDGTEDLITKLVPISSLPDLVRHGKIQHSLVVVALYHYELWRRGK
ncbi:MAG: NUDIX hydrolase [Verrucomicrobia bacterium]|nr:NUDIX hydrolase [Verrucomicrobiota bacterium]